MTDERTRVRTPTPAARAFKAQVERYVDEIAGDPEQQGMVKALRRHLAEGTFDQEPIDSEEAMREFLDRHRPS